VVIVTYDSAGEIGACLDSVERCLPGCEIIVIDNGSSDGTRELVRREHPAAIMLSGHGNIGFGRACNLGAARASAPLLLFLNPDAHLVRVDRAGLPAPRPGAAFGMAAAMLSEDGRPPRPTLRRQRGHWFGEFAAVHVLGIMSRLSPPPRYVERADGPGHYTVGGAAFLVATEEFRELGGFDERFFMYYEDTDLTRRYLQRGYPIAASAAVLVSHVGGASAPAPRSNALSFLGWLEYIEKWHGPKAAVRSAKIACAVYRPLLGALRVAGRVTGIAKVQNKAQELATMLAHVAAGGSGLGEPPLYLDAGAITSGVFGVFASRRARA
jgi:GT2 family glycosyltransferase